MASTFTAKAFFVLSVPVVVLVGFYAGYTGNWNSNIPTRGDSAPKYLVSYPNRSVDINTAKKEQTDLTYTNGRTLTLAIRMAAIPKYVQRFYCTMLRSTALFWSPKLGHISLILDQESERDHQFAARLSQQEQSLGFKFDLLYEPLPQDPTTLNHKKYRLPPGYMRQLWSSFFMDLYSNASIIAWTDTDGMFTTPVTPENIFNGDKLRVTSVTNWKIPLINDWDTATRLAIGKKMVANFSPYFPAFVWRDTFTNCRNHILTHMNVSRFEDAFVKMYPNRGFTAPVNIIMTYAFYFEHDRYDWHIDVNNNLNKYNNEHVSPGFKIQTNDILPEVHVTVHEPYYTRHANPMLQGYCIAKRYVATPPAGCGEFGNTTNFQLFEFATKAWAQNHFDTWCAPGKGREDCVQRIESYYRNAAKYYKLGLFDLDLQRVYAVEQAAARENISCSNLFKID